MWILHPSVIEVPLSPGERLDKGSHRLPSALAQVTGALGVMRDKGLPHPDVTGVLDGILVLLHQVTIDRLTHGGDAHGLQRLIITVLIHERKVSENPR